MKVRELHAIIEESLLKNFRMLQQERMKWGGKITDDDFERMLGAAAANLAQGLADRVHRDDCEGYEPCGECKCRELDREPNEEPPAFDGGDEQERRDLHAAGRGRLVR
jgi:hypothetical protein